MAGFESANPASERPQTYASDRAAAGIGNFLVPYQKPNVDHRRQAVGLEPDTVPSIHLYPFSQIVPYNSFLFSLTCSVIQVTVFRQVSPPIFVCYLPSCTYHHNTVGSEDIIVPMELAGVVTWLGAISENEIEVYCYHAFGLSGQRYKLPLYKIAERTILSIRIDMLRSISLKLCSCSVRTVCSK